MVEVNDWWQMLIIFVLAANPAGSAAGMASLHPRVDMDRHRWPIAATGVATSGAIAILAIAPAEPLVDALSVDQATFRLAAGAVLLIVAAQTIWRGYPFLHEPGSGWKAGIYPLGLPLVGGPAVIAAALNWSAEPDVGPWLTLTTVIPALLLSVGAAVLAPRTGAGVLAALSRLLGVLLALAGVAIIVSGVQAV